MVRAWLALTLALGAWVGPAGAQDLNAPVDQRPTVGSEIRRGFRSANKCSDEVMSKAFSDCVQKIRDTADSSLTTPKPFLTGLALSQMKIANDKAKNDTFDELPEGMKLQRVLFGIDADVGYQISKRLLKEQHMSLGKVINLLGDTKLAEVWIEQENAHER